MIRMGLSKKYEEIFYMLSVEALNLIINLFNNKSLEMFLKNE